MKDHPIVHFEIGSHDGEKTSEFFAELFGWKIAGDDAGRIINTGGEGGIGGHISGLASEWGTYVTVYIEVEDLDVYLKKAAELGGKTLVPPVPIPGQGSFAWLGSPEGHIVGIWKPE